LRSTAPDRSTNSENSSVDIKSTRLELDRMFTVLTLSE